MTRRMTVSALHAASVFDDESVYQIALRVEKPSRIVGKRVSAGVDTGLRPGGHWVVWLVVHDRVAAPRRAATKDLAQSTVRGTLVTQRILLLSATTLLFQRSKPYSKLP